MGWIVLTVLAGILVIAGIVTYAVLKSSRKAYVEAGRDPSAIFSPNWGLGIIIGVGALWFMITLGMMIKTVGQREVAIVYSFSGTIVDRKDPGVVTIWPWQHIKKENVGIQHDEWSFGEGNSAVSKDQQKVFGNLAVNYQINTANVLDLYKRVGAGWKTIIVNARVPQVFKEVTATYQTQDITANREKLREETRTRLQEELQPYDIDVVDVFVTNLGFSKSYTDAIEAKQKQVQDAQRQEAKIREATAIADQAIATAKGEATANVARAKGEAQANRLRRQSLTPALIQWEAIQKLNPNVQIIVCPPQAICVPNSGITPVPNGQP